jgi:hypothetical protein
VHTTPACPLTVIAWRPGGLTLEGLWSDHLALGGMSSRTALADYLRGTATWPVGAHDILAQTLDEALGELGCSSLAPHRNPWDDPQHFPPKTGPGRHEAS